MSIFQNLLNNYQLLFNDFTGFSVNFSGIGIILLHVIISLYLFLLFYFLGEKIRNNLFKKVTEYAFFINIALGFIAVGTGIGILGMLSLLTPFSVWAYLFVLSAISFFPYRISLKKKLFVSQIFSKIDKVVLTVIILFVSIGLLRLFTPEITEDGYHTDLPAFYLATGTSMHESRELLHVIPYPQLPEMIYAIPLSIGDREATRFIHFGFYLLVILLFIKISKIKEYKVTQYALLLFLTAPVVIRYSPTQYTDFFMVFGFLLSVVLIHKKMLHQEIFVAGLLLGIALATKLWTLIYLPAVLCYFILLNRHEKRNKIIKQIVIFIFGAFAVGLIWYLRAYFLTGNPIFPVLSHIISIAEPSIPSEGSLSRYISFNWRMFTYPNMAVLSPVFFLTAFLFLFNFKIIFSFIKKMPITLFILILTIEQLFIRVDFGRYLIAWYCVALLVVSVALYKLKIARIGTVIISCGLFLYYFISTLLILPYGFGWADKNAYLTRVLGRDNISYYDFNHLFDKWITKNDLVAVDGIANFYYADFSYIDIGYVFTADKRSLINLKEKKVTHLLIKGGDIEWFCKRLHITDCDTSKVKLLATYPPDFKKYNLYLVQY